MSGRPYYVRATITTGRRTDDGGWIVHERPVEWFETHEAARARAVELRDAYWSPIVGALLRMGGVVAPCAVEDAHGATLPGMHGWRAMVAHEEVTA